MPIAAVILALAVTGAVVGGAIVIGAPVFAIPVLAVVGAAALAYALGSRARRRPRREDDPIDFGEEDRATLVPSPSPEERKRNRREAARAIKR